MLATLSAFILKCAGWRIEGTLPERRKYVAIVAPHTSNWDFIIGLLARFQLDIPARFIGKHQLFRPPLGWLMRALGGRPVVRTQSNNLVEDVVAMFQQEPEFVLALAPEGTRSPVSHWKTGFYHIARGAGVPIVPVALDFRHRTIVIGQPLTPGECKAADMAQLLAFFRPHRGRFAQPIPHYQPRDKRSS
ncbi:lysophospholipid acyltransferase family protein [Ferrimonas balearica]|uniref:lysophospholipid acyltransferase family protein n=1 Tax=Ferrimonas balearica TaxID=44012 RepID=UPI001C5B2300|nr:lysophospholipid acyltransferase family protein [Ferrimonas balearica]MBW3166505.1 lysophospholipid acyltransferase family protein [Ferrimonas balearica]MBY5982104.1 lysophospholipid acyltransferase family protein [Ferrimonas balearica]MBY6226013.1 lysophospholipid acyltransferase family protein [Ferrimonas balearica]